jgi:hypothetical protein
MLMGWGYVSELPPTGLLFIPGWYMSMESMVESYRQGKTDSSTNALWLQQRHLVAKQVVGKKYPWI